MKSTITREWALKAAQASAAEERESDVVVQASRPTGKLLSTWPHGHPEQTMLYMNGRDGGSFHCPAGLAGGGICGCNVFTPIGENRYQCNSCQAEYVGARRESSPPTV